MVLFFHRTASLVMTEWAHESQTSFIDVLYLVCVDLKYLKWSTSSNTFPFIHILVEGLGWMLLTRILLLSAPILYRIKQLFFFWSPVFQQVAEFFFTASQQIDAVSKLQVAEQSFSSNVK